MKYSEFFFQSLFEICFFRSTLILLIATSALFICKSHIYNYIRKIYLIESTLVHRSSHFYFPQSWCGEKLLGIYKSSRCIEGIVATRFKNFIICTSFMTFSDYFSNLPASAVHFLVLHNIFFFSLALLSRTRINLQVHFIVSK